jgi:ribonuclease BN (tRNA processing enzyme)
MSFSVTVLGSSGIFSTRERAASGYLLRTGNRNVWIDAGGGTWRNLLGQLEYAQVDGVLLSHRHPDHTIDLFQALHARMHGGAEPLPPIPLWANAETLERVCSYASELEKSFDLREISRGQTLDIDGKKLSFYEMQHWCDTLGVRVEDEDATFAYSADTGPEADFAALAGGADLFICEATGQDSDPISIGHLRSSQAGAFAVQNRVSRLVLTHLPPERDLALSLAEADRTSEGVAVELAADGKTYEVGA